MKIKLTFLALSIALTAFTGTASAHDRGCHPIARGCHGHGFIGHGHCGHWVGRHFCGGHWVGGYYDVSAPVVETEVVETPVVETYAAPAVVDTDVEVDAGGYYQNGVWFRGYSHGYRYGRGHCFDRGHFGHSCGHVFSHSSHRR